MNCLICKIYSKFTYLVVEAFWSILVQENVSNFLSRPESYGLFSLGNLKIDEVRAICAVAPRSMEALVWNNGYYLE